MITVKVQIGKIVNRQIFSNASPILKFYPMTRVRKFFLFFLDWHRSMVCLTWKINIFQGFRRQPVCGGAAAHGVTPILHVDEVGGDDDERDGNGGVVKVQARPNVGTRLRT